MKRKLIQLYLPVIFVMEVMHIIMLLVMELEEQPRQMMEFVRHTVVLLRLGVVLMHFQLYL